jgi:hypothetical protein
LKAGGPDGSGHEEFRYGQGYVIRDAAAEEIEEAIEAAFDYRGDVTLFLDDGSELRGYLSNRNVRGSERFLDLHPSDGSAARRIEYGRLRGISFTGRDTAAGKSWETWVKKYRAKKEAEARGEQVEKVGLYPESLEG